MKNKYYLLPLFLVILLTSCGDGDNVDDKVETKDISRDGSIETIVTTEHLSNTEDVLVTTHRIWKNNILVKETLYRDTIPSLGESMKEVKDEKGNTKEALLKKDYEFYITVK